MKPHLNLRYWVVILATVGLVLFSRPVATRADVYVNHASVSLAWAANPETDVQGYEIHRATSSGGVYTKAHSGAISGASWTDTSVADDGIYYYKLRVVDVCGNFSDFSTPSGAAIIDLTSPTVTANPPAGTYYQGISVSLATSETATIYYTTDGSTPTQSSPIYIGPLTLTSDVTLGFLAVDRAGNQSIVATAQYVVTPSDGDFDDDGYPDNVEQAMGSDPYSAGSMPTATSLLLSPTQILAKMGATANLNVKGIFTPAGGSSMELDMTCLVQYKVDATAVASADACGTISCQSASTTTLWAEQIIGGQKRATSNTSVLTVDGSSPYVDELETHPYDYQGTSGDTGPTPRVPSDTGIIIRVVDDIGIDEQSVSLALDSTSVAATIWEINPGDSRELGVSYRNLGSFALDKLVTVQLSLTDLAGNAMNYSGTFQAENSSRHEWALSNTPVQTVSDLGGGAYELSATPLPDSINDELLDGASIIFSSAEPIEPRIGPVDEIPALDIAAAVGIPMNIEPANVFEGPITVVVPLPDVKLPDTNGDGLGDSGLEDYRIYYYTPEPTVQWRNALDVPGWLVEGSRVNHYETVPPAIEFQVNYSGVIQIGYECLTPSADFSANITTVETGEAILFQDNSFGTVTQWLWNFGDGTQSVAQNPSHSYAAPGNYSVTLTVTGSCGSDSTQKVGCISVFDKIHLSSPSNFARLPKRPSMKWTLGSNNMFKVEIASDSAFKQMLYTSPVLSTPQYPPYIMPSSAWVTLPLKRWVYWRVKGWANDTPDRVHTSAEVRTFMRTK